MIVLYYDQPDGFEGLKRFCFREINPNGSVLTTTDLKLAADYATAQDAETMRDQLALMRPNTAFKVGYVVTMTREEMLAMSH